MLDYYEQVERAFTAAKYHEDASFDLLSYRQSARATFHVRAYFWELQSVWDYTLLHANSRTLQLPTRQVRADSFLDKLQKRIPSYQHLARLRGVEADPLLKRIGRLRNEAHRFFTQPKYVVLRSEKEVAAFSITVEGSPSDQIILQREELSMLRKGIDALKADGFFI